MGSTTGGVVERDPEEATGGKRDENEKGGIDKRSVVGLTGPPVSKDKTGVHMGVPDLVTTCIWYKVVYTV